MKRTKEDYLKFAAENGLDVLEPTTLAKFEVSLRIEEEERKLREEFKERYNAYKTICCLVGKKALTLKVDELELLKEFEKNIESVISFFNKKVICSRVGE